MKEEDKILRFHYLGSTFTNDDYKYYSELLKKDGISIKKRNEGVPKGSMEDFMLVTYIFFSNPITLSILNDIKGNALWDIIKFIGQDAYRKMRGQKHYSTRTKKTKETSFGLEFQLDKNKSIKFQLNNINESEVNTAISKILKFLDKQNQKELKSNRYFASYVNEKWKSKDIRKEITKNVRKAMNKQQKEMAKSKSKKDKTKVKKSKK